MKSPSFDDVRMAGVSLFVALSFVATLHAQEIPQPAAAQAEPQAIDKAPIVAPAVPQESSDFQKATFFGKKFFDLGEYASAFEQFAKADALKPDEPAVLYDMAVVLARAGRYAESQQRVDRYVQLYPAGAERSLTNRLQLELEFQRELQKKRQAEQDYTELFNRGKFLFAKGDLDGALQLFEQAEQQRPNDPAPVYDEGIIHEKEGELDKAAERFRRYAELETDADAKRGVDQKIFAIESELQDMKSKLVCPFCGYRLPIGATWCPHCWHGPYLTSQPVWSSRPCVDGASATRATYYSDERFAKNDALPCLFEGTMLQALRYTPARQRAIQDARKSEGWIYAGEIIQGWNDKSGNQIRYQQGADYLERISSLGSGDVLDYAAHKGTADGVWLLDREAVIVDGQRYVSHYSYDAAGHIAQQQVAYQNAAACNHLIDMTADYTYQNDALVSVSIKGGYDGFAPEGAPRVDWTAKVAYSYDAGARVTREELAVTSWNKTYTQKPYGNLRDEISKIYPSMRVKRPLENLIRTGDLCATSGTLLVGNPIDLRPFYAMSPNLAMTLPSGVARAVVTFTYPDSYQVR